MELKELRQLEAKGLQDKLSLLKRELFNFRMEKQTSGASKVNVYKEAKKNVARIMTVLSEKQREK